MGNLHLQFWTRIGAMNRTGDTPVAETARPGDKSVAGPTRRFMGSLHGLTVAHWGHERSSTFQSRDGSCYGRRLDFGKSSYLSVHRKRNGADRSARVTVAFVAPNPEKDVADDRRATIRNTALRRANHRPEGGNATFGCRSHPGAVRLRNLKLKQPIETN